MQKLTRMQLEKGAVLTCFSTGQFKTSVLSVAFVLPISEDNALAALLPQVLARGSARCPDLYTLGMELDELYGARVFPVVRKVGENLVIGFLSDVIDQAYAEKGDNLVQRMIQLLAELLYHPYLNDAGEFCAEYVESEKENLIRKIRALKNDTRSYAVRRLQEVMCAEEPFGQCEYGTVEAVEKITPQILTAFWKDVLAKAPMQMFYCGGISAEEVRDAWTRVLDSRQETDTYTKTSIVHAPEKLRTVVEKMNIGQGKLSLGFRTGLTGADESYPALMLFTTIFGGYTGSRLFRYVREKMSLCYYASASLDKLKGLMVVSSGIENSNFEIARDAILDQLQDMQAGHLTLQELDEARRTMLDSLRSMNDAPASLERFFQSQEIGNLDYDLDSLCDKVEHLTLDEVLEVGRKIKLDTIYFLQGVEQA